VLLPLELKGYNRIINGQNVLEVASGKAAHQMSQSSQPYLAPGSPFQVGKILHVIKFNMCLLCNTV